MKMQSPSRLSFSLAGLALALCTLPASAQQADQSLARLKQVTGNVLVSGEAGLATGAQAQRLFKGSRVITTANSEAIVQFDSGCEVHLKENERFDVESDKPCALLAAVPVGAPVPAIGLGLAALVVPTQVGAVGLLGAGGSGSGPTPVSPN